jgi:5-methylcytosine-specific restriction endonuclease McrA
MAQAASRKLKAAMRGEQLAFDFGIAVVDADEARRARQREKSRRYRAANPEKVRENSRRYRAANPEKVRESFSRYYTANREQMTNRVRAYRAANRDEIRHRDRLNYAANREAKQASSRESARRRRAANPEKIREQKRQWNSKNPEKARERSRRYRVEKPDQAREAIHRYRARKRSNGVYLVTSRDLARLRNRQGGTCAWCDASENLHLDHIIPIARGGAHSIGNLQYLCAPHNLSKSASTRTEWLKRNPQPTDGRP